MVNQYWLAVMVLLNSCQLFKNHLSMYCQCTFKVTTLAGRYEESYLIPKGDTRFWLEKAILGTHYGNYGLGSVYYVKEHCPKVNRLLAKIPLNPLFYGRDFYPKSEPAEVANTTNLFYNADSSRMIIAFNIRATVLRLNGKQSDNCLQFLKKMYYRYAYNMDDVVEDEPLGLINCEYLAPLSEQEIQQKKYTPVKDRQSFKYETGD